MTPNYRVEFRPEAKDALRRAVAYIETSDGPERARSWLAGVRESAEGLQTLPGAFAAVQVMDGRTIRSKLVMERYRLYYVVDEPTRTVHIIDIVPTANESSLVKYRSS